MSPLFPRRGSSKSSGVTLGKRRELEADVAIGKTPEVVENGMSADTLGGSVCASAEADIRALGGGRIAGGDAGVITRETRPGATIGPLGRLTPCPGVVELRAAAGTGEDGGTRIGCDGVALTTSGVSSDAAAHSAS